MQGVPDDHVFNAGVVQQGEQQLPPAVVELGAHVVRQVVPGEIATQIRNNAGHYFMRALGDPLRTLSNLQTLHNDAWSHVGRSVRGWFYGSELQALANLQGQHLAREQEFNRRGLQQLFADLTQAFDNVLQTNVGPGTHEELQRLIDRADTATSIPLIAAERLSDGTPDEPGAYQVTAAAAAAVGRYGNTAPPLRVPEAIPAVGIDRYQPPADIIGRTAQTPENLDGIPVVRAEMVTEAPHDIPVVQAYNISPPRNVNANDSSL